jgi:hypothetical protein
MHLNDQSGESERIFGGMGQVIADEGISVSPEILSKFE